jgi:hypothetical protein
MGVTIPGVPGSVKPLQLRVGDEEKFTSASMCFMGVTIPGVPSCVKPLQLWVGDEEKFTSASMCFMGVTIPGVPSCVKPLQLWVGDVGEVHLRLHEGLHHPEEGGIADAAQLRHVLQEHPSRETEDILRHLARRSPAPASHHYFSTVGGRGGGGGGG